MVHVAQEGRVVHVAQEGRVVHQHFHLEQSDEEQHSLIEMKFLLCTYTLVTCSSVNLLLNYIVI